MTSILSLPPEILLEIFEWATYDPGLFDHTPSWKHYDLSLRRPDSDIPWPPPPRTSEEPIGALRLVCSSWRALAVGFEFRHIRIERALRLLGTLGWLRATPGAGNSVKRITLSFSPSGRGPRLWEEEDTRQMGELLKLCPNLEVFSLESIAASPPGYWLVGAAILSTLTSSCTKLRRLHWRGRYPFEVSVLKWTPALAPLSSLEALEIGSYAEETAVAIPEDPLCLPSLKHLRVSTTREADRDLMLVLTKWTLPSLISLHLAAPHLPCDQLFRLFLKFGGSLKSLSLDANTSFTFPMDILAEASLEQLTIYNALGWTLRPSVPLPSISTVVVRLFTDHNDTTLGICSSISAVAWISKDHFAQLEKVVIIGRPIENLDQPCHIADLSVFRDAGLACKRWDEQGVQVVNRRGIRVWKREELPAPQVE